ncbi:MAG TPA: hypothetical protein VM243_11425, partial [Phycisphaerae bacterium]|nr:hypothetical protein [Phycisphaerae bacterium]
FGRQQEMVTAVDDALVLGHSDSSAAFPGMPIMAFGIEDATIARPALRRARRKTASGRDSG